MRMAKDLEENAEIQQLPKREGRNMIMFLSPRKSPGGKPAGVAPAPARPRTITTPAPVAAPVPAAALTPEPQLEPEPASQPG
jgi:translation initiation factor IF-3